MIVVKRKKAKKNIRFEATQLENKINHLEKKNHIDIDVIKKS